MALFALKTPWSGGSSKPPLVPTPFPTGVLYCSEVNSPPYYNYIGGGAAVCLTGAPIDVTPYFSTYRSGNDARASIFFRIAVEASEPLSQFSVIMNSSSGGGAGIIFPAAFSVNPLGWEIYEGQLCLGGSTGPLTQFVQGFVWAKNSGQIQQFSTSAISLYSGVITLNLAIVPGASNGTAYAAIPLVEAKVVTL